MVEVLDLRDGESKIYRNKIEIWHYKGIIWSSNIKCHKMVQSFLQSFLKLMIFLILTYSFYELIRIWIINTDSLIFSILFRSLLYLLAFENLVLLIHPFRSKILLQASTSHTTFFCSFWFTSFLMPILSNIT